MSTEPTPGIGHNLDPLSPEGIVATLDADNVDLLARSEALLAAFERLPEKIEDATTAGRAADFVKQVRACGRKLDDTRMEAKRPYTDAGNTVQGFFSSHITALKQIMDAVNRRLTDRLERERIEAERVAKEERDRLAAEQRQRDEEARAKAEEIERKRAEAEAAGEPEIEIEPEPEPEPEIVDTKPVAAKAQVRGDYGAVSSTRESWAFEITDLRKIPLAALRTHLSREVIEKALRSYMRANKDTLTPDALKGVTFKKERKAITR